jgi:hypothetical protein
MYLRQNNFLFGSAVQAKRNTLLAAIELVLELEQTMKFSDLNSEEKDIFETAIADFKISIQHENMSHQGALYMREQSQMFFNTLNASSVSNHLSQRYIDNAASYQKVLEQQDRQELSRHRLIMGAIILGVSLVSAVLLTAYVALCVINPLCVALTPIVGAFVGLAAGILYNACKSYNGRHEDQRDIVGEGLALDNINIRLTVQTAEPIANETEYNRHLPMAAAVIAPPTNT